MKLAEIEQAALALEEADRASLAAKLLGTLPPAAADVSDEEVQRREDEMDSGKVTPVSHADFVRQVRRSRTR